jgi:serine/threonine-protein kinase
MHTSMQTQGPGLPRSAAAGFAPGAQIGPWRVEGELGKGGMSTVYAVVHVDIGKRAAMKVVHGHVLSSAFTAERVILEAKVVNQIGHPSIVDIFESGTLDDGRPYLVMERLDGQNLGQRLADGRIPHETIIGILIQICEALTAAHAAGIVHRDLKLDNVFLVDSPDGLRVKVLDWGIAKIVTASPRNTFADRLIGTPQYVSPEQARGGAITPAADIYSLGIMAYELFLDGPPFVSESAAELLVMHLRDDPPAPHAVWPDIPPALEGLLLAMLAKSSTARPSAAEVAADLEVIRHQLRRRAALRPDAPAMTAPAIERTPAPATAAAVEPVALGAGGAGGAGAADRDDDFVDEETGLADDAVDGAVAVDDDDAIDAVDVRRSVPPTRLRRRPPWLAHGRLRFAAAAILLLVGGGAIDALLAADTALEADAEAVTAPAAAETAGTTDPAPAGVIAAPRALRPATQLADTTPAATPETKPQRREPRREIKPDGKSGRSDRKERSRAKRRPRPPEARPAPAVADTGTRPSGGPAPGAGGPAPGATPSIGGIPLRPARAERPRREISQVDPDGTIEPYK